jgi:glycosyltransferase involved in cell wall biosynthesis
VRVTLITATYNSGASIKTCLDSVVSQDYDVFEYLIIDGKSSDETLSIVEDYQKKYFYIKLISEKDEGIYDALNKGVLLATGDVIGFVHSDDLLASKTVISEIVATLKNEKLDGVYGDLEYVRKEDTSKVVRFWKSRSFNSKLLSKGWMPAHPTLFLKKEVYEKHGFFNLGYKISADYDFMLRILKDDSLKFGYLPKVITKMRVGGASNGSINNIINKTKEDYRAIRSNQIGGWFSILIKNTSKIKQLFIRG